MPKPRRVTILKQGDRLIAALPGALADAELRAFQADVVAAVGHTGARGVLIDVAALWEMDSFATRTLMATAQMIRLRGAQTVIVGIQPDVAFAMVQLGLQLRGVATALDLEEGLAYLDRHLKPAGRP